MAGENPNVEQQVPEGDREAGAPPVVEETRSLRTVIFSGSYGMLPVTGPITEEQLRIVSLHYAIKGALFTLVGIFAMIFPYVFGLALDQLWGWCLVLVGVVTFFQSLMLCDSPGGITFVLLGLLHFFVGLWLVVKPLEALTALPLFFSGWYLAHGFLKLVMAWQVRHMKSWPAPLVSGVLSLLWGVCIVWLVPTYGLKLLGLLFGAELTFTGLSVLIIAIIAHFYRGSLNLSQGDVENGTTREPLLRQALHMAEKLGKYQS